jgi:bacterioferritin-associated ferredoxin
MKKKTIALSLTMALMIGIGTTAYAATSNSQMGMKNRSGMGMSKTESFRGHGFLTNLLKEKGATDEEIKSALDSGKSLYDLAKEKGITDDQIKEFMVTEQTKHIDDAIAAGKMTAAQGDEAKTKLKEASANWNFQAQGNGGMMKGSMGMGSGRHNAFTNLLKEKGATDEEIKSALDSGKSLYDFSKEKGITDDQIKEFILTEQTKHIDDAVSAGKMTAAQGDEAKAKLKEASANWNFQSQGNRMMKGFMGMEHKGKMGMNKQQNNATSN